MASKREKAFRAGMLVGLLVVAATLPGCSEETSEAAEQGGSPTVTGGTITGSGGTGTSPAQENKGGSRPAASTGSGGKALRGNESPGGGRGAGEPGAGAGGTGSGGKSSSLGGRPSSAGGSAAGSGGSGGVPSDPSWCIREYDLQSYSGSTEGLCPASEVTFCDCPDWGAAASVVCAPDSSLCFSQGTCCGECTAICGWLNCERGESEHEVCQSMADEVERLKSGGAAQLSGPCVNDADCPAPELCVVRVYNLMFCGVPGQAGAGGRAGAGGVGSGGAAGEASQAGAAGGN